MIIISAAQQATTPHTLRFDVWRLPVQSQARSSLCPVPVKKKTLAWAL
jgi:hypothetical protein